MLAFLENIIEEGYPLPPLLSIQDELWNITEALCTSDSDMRESAYSVLSEWIFNEKMSSDVLFRYAVQLINSKLVTEGGYDSECSVKIQCQRSFVLLVYAKLLEKNMQTAFISEIFLEKFKQDFILVATNENHAVAFLLECEWIHLYAHFADAIKYWFMQKQVLDKDKMEVFEVTLYMIAHADQVFEEAEEERIALAFYQLVKNNVLSPAALLEKLYQKRNEHQHDVCPRIAYTNFKHIIHAMLILLSMKHEIIMADYIEQENPVFSRQLVK